MSGYKPRMPGTTAEAIERAIDEVGGPRRAADLLGIGRSAAYALSDPDPNAYAPLSLLQANVLSSSGATALAEHLAAAAGGVFVPLVEDSCELALHALVGRMSKEGGEAVSEILRGLADGKFDALDARRAQPEIMEALRALSAALGACAAASEAGRP